MHWLLAEMQDRMETHLHLPPQGAVAQLTGDCATSVSRYEQVRVEILEVADKLSAGIIARFPSIFTGPYAM